MKAVILGNMVLDIRMCGLCLVEGGFQKWAYILIQNFATTLDMWIKKIGVV